MSVLFYVSGHGYGHAVRMAEVIRAGAPEWTAAVRTEAPERLFPGARVERARIDATIAESADTLRIDPKQTLENWMEFLAARDSILRREVEYVRDSGVRLMVADIPFLAGEIAAAAGVPCIGISNFTWSWILEPHFADDPRGREALRAIEAGYSKMTEYWRLPFAAPEDRSTFRRVVETPLIAPATPPAERNGRRVVLLGFRGAVPIEAFRRAAAAMPDTLFRTSDPEQASAAPNAELVEFTAERPFAAAAASSDVILAKLGFSLVALCAADKHRLLYAPREGFREDAITSIEAQRYTALRGIPIADFEEGNWRPHIERLLAQSMPAERIARDGAAVCAARIAARLKLR